MDIVNWFKHEKTQASEPKRVTVSYLQTQVSFTNQTQTCLHYELGSDDTENTLLTKQIERKKNEMILGLKNIVTGDGDNQQINTKNAYLLQ